MALDPLGKARPGEIVRLLAKGQQQQVFHRTGHQGERRCLEQVGQIEGVVIGAPAKADHALAHRVEQVVPHQLVDKGEQLWVLGDEAVAAVVEAIVAVAPFEGLGGAHAAHDRLLLEQGDRKTGLAEAPGGHQPCGTGTQHRNAFLVVVAHDCLSEKSGKGRGLKSGPLAAFEGTAQRAISLGPWVDSCDARG